MGKGRHSHAGSGLQEAAVEGKAGCVQGSKRFLYPMLGPPGTPWHGSGGQVGKTTSSLSRS